MVAGMCLSCGSLPPPEQPVVWTPFHCEDCGTLNFTPVPGGAKLFIWPDPQPEYFGKIFLLPDVREDTGLGTILAVGKGYYVPAKNGAWKFKRSQSELKPGVRVLYDVTTPWRMHFKNHKGQELEVRFMGEQDVMGLVTEEKKVSA